VKIDPALPWRCGVNFCPGASGAAGTDVGFGVFYIDSDHGLGSCAVDDELQK
jgi:hypothetical protein